MATTLTHRLAGASAASSIQVESIPLKKEEIPTSDAAARGAAVYSKSWVIVLYDWWVLGVVSSFAWACSVPNFILPFFQRNIRKGNHLDIGVGTGYHLAHTDLSGVHLTLADLNEDSIAATASRLENAGKVQQGQVKALLHDITRPLPDSCPKFDSISMYYLLHCMPGPCVPAKTAVFSHLKHSLKEDGVLSGTSVLGKGVHHNLFGRAILYLGNDINGMFDNRGDSAEDFEEALRDNFGEVECEVRGAVFCFKASKPKV
ncbi:MAG: hypothetical protein LQ351_002463 [Letrouitia transgressa]|nr:MAG: hypothetical protein LQ351_002463 [Letrouitia transgressa]